MQKSKANTKPQGVLDVSFDNTLDGKNVSEKKKSSFLDFLKDNVDTFQQVQELMNKDLAPEPGKFADGGPYDFKGRIDKWKNNRLDRKEERDYQSQRKIDVANERFRVKENSILAESNRKAELEGLDPDDEGLDEKIVQTVPGFENTDIGKYHSEKLKQQNINKVSIDNKDIQDDYSDDTINDGPYSHDNQWNNGGKTVIGGLNMLSNRRKENAQERKNFSEQSNVFNLYKTGKNDRGDYMSNVPGFGDSFRPDDHVRKGFNTKTAEDGISISDEMELTEEEIAKLKEDGYEFEYLD